MTNILRKIYVALIFVFLYAPIGTLIVLSFNASNPEQNGVALLLNGMWNYSKTKL